MENFDFQAAARDVDIRAHRWAKLLSTYPHIRLCYRLITRNPWAAKEAARAILRIIEAHPDKAISPDSPLFRAR